MPGSVLQQGELGRASWHLQPRQRGAEHHARLPALQSNKVPPFACSTHRLRLLSSCGAHQEHGGRTWLLSLNPELGAWLGSAEPGGIHGPTQASGTGLAAAQGLRKAAAPQPSTSKGFEACTKSRERGARACKRSSPGLSTHSSLGTHELRGRCVTGSSTLSARCKGTALQAPG